MKKYFLFLGIVLFFSCVENHLPEKLAVTVIRINQLGYLPETIKVAVFGAKTSTIVDMFTLHDAVTDHEVFRSTSPESKGTYVPFESSYRLNFSNLFLNKLKLIETVLNFTQSTPLLW